MDEQQLAKMLGAIKAPAPGETPKKQALEAALAAFDENISKNAQGYGAGDSLTDMKPEKGSGHNVRRLFMQKSRSWSGMTGAVALCALVAVLGTPFIAHEINSIIGPMSGSIDAQMDDSLSGKDGKSIKTVNGTAANNPNYLKQAKEQNEKQAAQMGASAIPTPTGLAPSPAPSSEAATFQGMSNNVISANPPPPADGQMRAWRQKSEQAPMYTDKGQTGAEVAGRIRANEAVAPTHDLRDAKDDAKNKADALSSVVEAKKTLAAPMSPAAAVPGNQPAVTGGAVIAPQMQQGMAMPVAPGIVVSPPMERYQPQFYQENGRDSFPDYKDNSVMEVASDPVSTFSIDVDTSSYSFLRRSINEGHLPPRGAVRLEEMINYFHYNYAVPQNKADPFLPTVAVFDCPWHKGDKLVHIGIKGYEPAERPKSNIVFLIDTSGSMNSPDKLPLLVSSFKLMLDSLKPGDTVGIVTYAGNAGVALEPTPATDKAKILSVLDNLSAGGSTAGAQGLQAAYQLADQAFIKGGNNRILLATDGDFNVGISSQDGLKDLITKERDHGVYLSVLGFGMGNYQDTTMQTLAQNGNGNASYIDNLSEAHKVLVEEASSTLFTIAKDVKIQVEFNPAAVQEYRLLGYETRHLNREDFNNDKIDAGEIGAGHAVTAIYEITPVGAQPLVDKLRYGSDADTAAQKQRPAVRDEAAGAEGKGDEYAFLKIRYKKPDSDTSTLMTRPITKEDEKPFDALSDDSRFATAVAGFGQLLRGSNYIGNLGYDDVIKMAAAAKGTDEDGYRGEFVNLVKLAKSEAGDASAPSTGGEPPVEPQPVPMIQK